MGKAMPVLTSSVRFVEHAPDECRQPTSLPNPTRLGEESAGELLPKTEVKGGLPFTSNVHFNVFFNVSDQNGLILGIQTCHDVSPMVNPTVQLII